MHILCIPSHPSHAPHPPLRCVCTGLRRWRLPDAWGHGLSILTSPASPRTYYAPLRMYGGTEIASSRRVGSCGSLSSHPLHLPAHTTLRCVCTGLRRWRLPDALPLAILIYNHFSYFPFLYFSLYVEMLLEYSFRLFSFMTSCHFCSVTIIS